VPADAALLLQADGAPFQLEEDVVSVANLGSAVRASRCVDVESAIVTSSTGSVPSL
jgi:hypothetical protein